jgi:hypothetical protein
MDNTASARKDVVKGTENDSEVKINGNTEEINMMESESSCNSMKRQTSPNTYENENNGEMEVGSLWPVWRDPTAHLSESAGSFWRTHGDPDDDDGDTEKHVVVAVPSEHENAVCAYLERFVVEPTSMQRTGWDMVSLVLIIYDLLTVPLLVFGYDELDLASNMRSITMVYWTVDILASFLTGYQSELGVVEVRLRVVARDYVRHRFPFDLFVVMMDWIMFWNTVTNLAVIFRLGKTVRIVRILRLLRLLRLARLKEIGGNVSAAFSSNAVFSLMNILRLIVLVMLINHFFACGWYGVGTLSGGDLSDSWIADLERDDASAFTRYLASYQWSLAQFTPSPTRHGPANTGERLYAILILFIGMVIYSAMLGNVTTIINHARADAFNKMVQDSKLRIYLAENSISDDLAHAITLFIKDKGIRKRKTTECDVRLIESLPRHLKEELHYEVYSPVLGMHHFFTVVCSHHRSTFVAVCHSAAIEKVLAKGDEPIFFGKNGTSMMFPIAGSLQYKAGPETDHLVSDNPVTLTPGAWITEAPLWIKWEHLGLVSVHDFCDIVEMDSYEFRKVMVQNTTVLTAFCHYAHLFAKAVKEASEAGMDIDDLWGTPCGAHNEALQVSSEMEELVKFHAAGRKSKVASPVIPQPVPGLSSG